LDDIRLPNIGQVRTSEYSGDNRTANLGTEFLIELGADAYKWGKERLKRWKKGELQLSELGELVWLLHLLVAFRYAFSSKVHYTTLQVYRTLASTHLHQILLGPWLLEKNQMYLNTLIGESSANQIVELMTSNESIENEAQTIVEVSEILRNWLSQRAEIIAAPVYARSLGSSSIRVSTFGTAAASATSAASPPPPSQLPSIFSPSAIIRSAAAVASVSAASTLAALSPPMSSYAAMNHTLLSPNVSPSLPQPHAAAANSHSAFRVLFNEKDRAATTSARANSFK
jgi:hypothetical protein